MEKKQIILDFINWHNKQYPEKYITNTKLGKYLISGIGKETPYESPALNKNIDMNSFRKRTFIEVFCAKCGIRYSDDAEYEKVFENKEEAIETITEGDWTVKGTKAFCENCS